MKNAEWMLRNGYSFINLRAFDADNANRAYKIGLCMEGYTWEWVGEVTKVYHDKSTAVLAWLDSEHKEPILDEVEKRYLAGVIRPFRDNVKFVKKCEYHFSCGDFDQIFIRIENKWSGDRENMFFPEFIKGTMYKGMEVDRKYTLEELGL